LRILAHLSDLHFGRLDEAVLPALTRTIRDAKPDVVVVSGDLTQRARRREFAAARRYLDELPSPQIVVPGNHDVPMDDMLSRWLSPLANYRRYISEDTEPFYADEEIAVLGVNTARSNVIKGGRINRKQVARSCERLEGAGKGITRVIVTHHPFDLPQSEAGGALVGRADMAMAGFAGCRVDLILSGHMHVSHRSDSAARYRIPGYSALMVQAGTATSSRRRGELNAYNIIRIERPRIAIDTLTWDGETGNFLLSGTDHFQFGLEGWSRIADGTARELE
jgi:3',5'-cyclic AMP phosphodiesterase CpdA